MILCFSFVFKIKVFLFSDYTLGDIWFLKINISSAFENSDLSSFSKENFDGRKCAFYFSSIHLHGILMFLGWAFFINFFNISTKYLKSYSKKFIKIINYILLVKK